MLIQLISNPLWAKEIKDSESKNISFGAIPVFSYDADLGLKYGAVVNVFDSKIKKYPDYDQYLNLKLTHTTRNTLNLQALFESTRLIPKATTFLEATYTNDQKLDFFGFNGNEVSYKQNFANENHYDFIDRKFYTIDRKLVRLRADVQKNITSNQFRLLTGITYHRLLFNMPETNNTNKGIANSLYRNYIEWGIIDEQEKEGGRSTSATLGLIYDTRNDKLYCTNGSWFEGFVVYAPGLVNEQTYSKLVLTYRTYHSFRDEKYTLSMRLSSQSRLSGEIPSYLLPFYFDSQINQDGLGGAYTLRGITRNRIVADGFAMGNFETRIQLKEFSLLNLDFQLSSTFFVDMAYITQRRQVNLNRVPDELKNNFFTHHGQQLHTSFGPGLNITFNQNNITTVNYGFSTNSQLGKGGLYIGSRFLF